RGVVSLPHGFGHTKAGTRAHEASAYPGVSFNDLTGDATDAATGNAALNGIAVTIALAREG
ncbi:MAG: hypothetical protein KGN02_13650, partial [bacterium]|nr:hypothetical protein [bacterium]